MWVEMEVETKEGDDGLKWGIRGWLSEIPICE